MSGSPLLASQMLPPIFSERAQPLQRFSIFPSIGGHFARNDVIEATDRESFDLDSTLPSVIKPLDSIRRKDKVQIERAVLQLYEVPASFNVG